MAPPNTRMRTSVTKDIRSEDGDTDSSQGSDFERFVRTALLNIKDAQLPNMQKKLDSLEKSLVFEAKRITEVTEKVKKTEKQVSEIERLLAKHDLQLNKMAEAENKLERFSRRNNLRIVGLKEKSGEKPLELVSKILSEKFDMNDPQLERAHRDGKKVDTGARSRHMLVKMLRYQDKLMIMRQQRQQLEDCDYYITDDLTKADLEEKRKHKKEVKFLYDRGIKLYFSAGKWRDRNGNLASFYNANTPGLIIEDAASQAGNASQRGRLANQREIDVEIHPHPEEEEEEVSE